LKIDEFILCTIHREENIDNITRLKKILISLGKISSEFNKKIIFPCHPRTLKMIKTKKINLDSNIILVNPLPYNEFLNLLYYSYIVISDSGGVQEECCLLKKRLITIRTKTERQETLKIGCNKLSNVYFKEIIKKIKQLQNSKIKWSNPYGKNVSDKIIKILRKI
jgi:UDP-N-acetylglucosamine 2-epimerase (non-hydrolysing)